MNFDVRSKIEKAAAAESSRYAINGVYLDAQHSVLAATDGCILAVVPCELADSDTAGVVPAEAFARARRIAGKRGTPSLACNGTVRLVDDTTFARPDQRFPDYRDVLTTAATTFRVSLDAAALLRLAQALGSEWVTLEFTDENRQGYAFRVRPAADDAIQNAIGIMMPLNIK